MYSNDFKNNEGCNKKYCQKIDDKRMLIKEKRERRIKEKETNKKRRDEYDD